MPSTSSDLLSARLTVEHLTVTISKVWADRDLTAPVAVTMRFLCATEEVLVQARG